MGFWTNLFSLEGELIRLIPMELEHVDQLWEVAKNEQIWSYMASKITTIEEMKLAVEGALFERERKVQYPFVVVVKGSGKVIGSTRYLDIQPHNRSLEIGWTWYHPDYWRTRVNSECKWLLLTHAFEYWDLNRVIFKTDSRNARSQAAISRLGAVKEGVLRKDRILADGYVRDTVVFSIIDDEWPVVKDRLAKKLQLK